MLKYVFKRLLVLIPIIAGGTFMVFMIMFTPVDLSSYDPHWDWQRQAGLLDPVWVLYLRYMAGVLTGNFGISFRNHIPITGEIMMRLPYTLWLSLAALSFSLILAVPAGIIAAVKRNTWIDKVSMLIALIGISIPSMWAGILLMLFFSRHMSWAPLSGALQWSYVVLPGMALGYAILFAMIRTVRSSMIEVINKDYIRVVRAKGLSNGKVVFKHALPNIIIPVLESFKAHMGAFFTCLIIAEYLFSWPGIGRLLLQSIAARDYPVILGCLVVFVFFFAFVNFVIDIAKAFADPHIRRERLC